jgi:BTB/POZ domain-containing protein KCTD9
MLKSEAMKLFNEKYVEEIHNTKITELRDYIEKNIEFIELEIIKSFKSICQKIINMQSEGLKKEIGFINYSLLRSQLIQNKDLFFINAYNEDWYIDKVECEDIYNANWAFKYLHEFEQIILKESRKYVGKIQKYDIKKIKLEKVNFYIPYIIAVGRKAFEKVELLEEYSQIKKDKRFEIRMGEYLDYSEVVYFNDIIDKNDEITKKQLENKKEIVKRYIRYADMNLEQGNYDYSQFIYTEFLKCNLENSKFNFNNLQGVKFVECNLTNSMFENGLMLGSDFSNSDLKNSRLNNVNEGAVFETKIIESILFKKNNFTGVDLSNSSIRNSNFSGSNFEASNLEGVDFENTILKGAIFPSKYKSDDTVKLTQEQKNVIIWGK